MSEDHDQLDPAEALMREVGAQLRQVRLERGEDLDEVGQNLRIKPAYLSGIEQGDLSTMPGRTYALGFLRSYADYLGFDGDDLITQIKSTVANLTDKTRLRMRTPLPESRLPKTPILVLSLAAVAGIYTGWSYVNHGSQLVIDTVAEVPASLRDLALGALGEAGEDDAPPAGATSPASPRRPPAAAGSMAQEARSAAARAAPLPAAGESLGSGLPAGPPSAPPPAAGVTAPDPGAVPAAAPPPATNAGQAPTIEPAEAVGPGPLPVPGIAPEAGPAPAPDLAGSDAPAGPIAGRDAPAALPTAPAPAQILPTETPPAETATAQTPPIETPPIETPPIETPPIEPAPFETPPTEAKPAEAVPADRSPMVVAVAPTGPDGAAEAAGAAGEPGASLTDAEADSLQSPLAALPFVPGTVGRIHEPDNADARVVLRAVDNTWIQISSVAGDYLRDRTLERGDVFLVPNRPDLALWTGNAGGLELIVDGEVLAPLGGDGDVVRDVPLDPPSLQARFGQLLVR